MGKRYEVYVSEFIDGTQEEWSVDLHSCSSSDEWQDAQFWAYHLSGGKYAQKASDSPVGEVETYHSLKQWYERRPV